MNLKLALASTLFIACVTGCGGSDFDPETGFTGGANCPQSLIDAHNAVVYQCDNLITRSDAQLCKSSVDAFLSENPNVDCDAVDTATGFTMNINSDDYRETQAELRALLLGM